MSEPSRDTEEVTSSIGAKIQATTSLVVELATLWSQQSAEKARAIQDAAQAAERANRDRIKALREGDMPIMRQAWSERWWKAASAEEIGLVWETTGGWARNGDPYARRTHERLREQIQGRFGVRLDNEPISHTLVTQVLAGADTDRPIGFLIRDIQSGTAVEQGRLTVQADDRRPPGVVAADRIREFTEQREADGEPAGRYVIETYDASLPGGERRWMVRDDQATALREEYDQWAQSVLAGTADPAPLDRVRDVYLVEQSRLRQELARLQAADPRVVAARETLADEVRLRDGGQRRVPPARASERASAEDHAAQVAELQERLTDIELRVDRVTADLRGEDAALVTEATVLRRDLDQQWWQTATPEEVAGIWTHVDGWPQGAAQRGMRTELQAQILRHHGVDVGPGASFEQVSGELQRAQADRAGERILRFRITSPGLPRPAGDEFAAPAATIEASGILRVSKDTPLPDAAHAQLRTYAGDLTAARDRRLVITMADYAGAPLGAFNAAGPLLEEAAQRAGGPLVDSGALRDLAETGPEAAEAVQTAERARPAWPEEEPPASGGLRRSRRREGNRGLGETRPRSWDRLNPPHRGPEEGR